MSSLEVDLFDKCPICTQSLKPPIGQCKNGHNMCQECMKQAKITECPICKGPLSDTRNYTLEKLLTMIIESNRTTCIYHPQGCKFTVLLKDKEAHEAECRYRTYLCEGHIFAKWPCSWWGNYANVYQHFKDSHKNHTTMNFKTKSTMKINFLNTYDIQIISHPSHYYFYYKHKVDMEAEKVYWTFQLIGLRSQAKHFYYSFKIHDGWKKIEVIEMCHSDSVDAEEIFQSEKCVAISFASLKNFLNDQQEISFDFNIFKPYVQVEN
ncbi:unnamed protein product [Phyllotreta striolata]|uniref:E3 ubiquitin-protein ligase n=1 Tax=Phyllotreta striolata TaxID=444603 RepID=A0A9N9XND4_PHYSR|nr:unnamed protein product [Phyllotreta striolata]